MWVFFDGGFVSIVQNARRPYELLVRARARKDLVKFCELAAVAPHRNIETPDRDYRWRRSMTRGQVRLALSRIADLVDYTNFKERVARTDLERAHIYGAVWGAALPIDERHRPRRTDEELDDGDG